MNNTPKMLLLSLLMLTASSRADELMVAVAANFAVPMQQITKAFEQQSGHKLHLALGSSGKLYAQIVNGGPYDVFFSADQSKPRALIKQDLALASTHLTYALGALALWSANPQKINQNSDVLVSGQFNKLALANPKLAPYGVAAMDVLANLQLTDATRARWVQGENIAQTYQFVASHNADIGFVALSQIMQDGELTSGSAWIISPDLYQPIKQDAVILKRAADSSAAKDLLTFVQSNQAKQIILSFGYQLEPAHP